MSETVDIEAGEATNTTEVTDAELQAAVVEVDRAGRELDAAKDEAKEAKQQYEAAQERLFRLAQRRFCRDAAPLFEQEDDDGSDE